MVEEGRRQDKQLEYQDALPRNVERDDHHGAGAGAQQHLAEMEAHRRGGIEKTVQVMDFVEAPQERDLVVGAMPPIDQRIEDQQIDQHCRRARPRRRAPSGYFCRPDRHRYDDKGRQGRGEAPEHTVAHKPAPTMAAVLRLAVRRCGD